ncbi:MAG: hypothetical protein JO261_01170 [Alphaproteobacteria bacterium]|nr:hypothetical protein [Alphaproteobacteria bacterium]MBV9692287.1 hypothetical protein [Alphaproteobacteria bacterium]
MRGDDITGALLAASSDPSDGASAVLLGDIERHPLTPVLFPGADLHGVLAERLAWWRRFAGGPDGTAIMATGRPEQVWRYPLALAQHLAGTQAVIVGICGPPGSGKSTLSAALCALFRSRAPDLRFLAVSLDDFYHPKDVRERLGLRWRAAPGSHDLDAAVQCLAAIRERRQSLRLPTFDQARDDRGPTRTIEGPIATAFVDGWFLGLREHGYERVADLLDYLVYLDCPTSLARRRRFGREDRIRAEAGGASAGLSAEQMEDFWSEVLGPGIARWVEPVRKAADLVVALDEDGDAVGGTRKER